MDEKLLHVFYEDDSDLPTIREYLSSVDRLEELIHIEKTEGMHPEISNAVYISESRIHIMPDWLETRPALVFPSEIPFNKHCFLGSVFGLLGNEEKYREYLTGLSPLVFVFDLIRVIANAERADHALEAILKRRTFANPFENYVFNHNVAIALNYGSFSGEINPDAIKAHYNDALQLAFEPSFRALTLKYYATFLMDIGENRNALGVLAQGELKHPGDYPHYSLEKVWCHAKIRMLNFTEDENSLSELKTRLWNALRFFESKNHNNIAAFLLMDAATIANLSASYAESLGYINKALTYFKDGGQKEMTAQAQLVRGKLFYLWAQSGNPQFYRNALESYQEALSVFKKDQAPEVFADIHHQLGIIYAELPDENKKRSIWAALSVTSFNEALEYFSKEDFPYQYGMVYNNYGNAFTKFPPSKNTDNFGKALGFYGKALSVRNADEFPAERAVTLLNFLEASWKAANPEEGFNRNRYDDMLEKANEIKSLTTDEQLLMEAEKHLGLLKDLEKKSEEEFREADNA